MGQPETSHMGAILGVFLPLCSVLLLVSVQPSKVAIGNQNMPLSADIPALSLCNRP